MYIRNGIKILVSYIEPGDKFPINGRKLSKLLFYIVLCNDSLARSLSL